MLVANLTLISQVQAKNASLILEVTRSLIPSFQLGNKHGIHGKKR